MGVSLQRYTGSPTTGISIVADFDWLFKENVSRTYHAKERKEEGRQILYVCIKLYQRLVPLLNTIRILHQPSSMCGHGFKSHQLHQLLDEYHTKSDLTIV
jgi:hypothetical protein